MAVLALAVLLAAWYTTAGQAVIGLAAVLASLAVIVHAPPMRWLFRTLVANPIMSSFRQLISEVVDERLAARPLTNGWGIDAVKKIADAVDAGVESPTTDAPDA